MGAAGSQPRGLLRRKLNTGAFFEQQTVVMLRAFKRPMARQRKSSTLSDHYRALISFIGAAPCSVMPSIFLITSFMCFTIVAALVASQLPANQFHIRARAGIPTQTHTLHVLQVKFFPVVQAVQTTVHVAPKVLQQLMLVSVPAEFSAHSGVLASAVTLALLRRSGFLAEY